LRQGLRDFDKLLLTNSKVDDGVLGSICR
jgi:hypothetical protein